MFDKKTTTVVIALLAFAVMYSTFVTESDYTTGKFTRDYASEDWIVETPENPYQPDRYKSRNNPFFDDAVENDCVEITEGVVYNGKTYKNYQKTAREKVVYYCDEGGSVRSRNVYL